MWPYYDVTLDILYFIALPSCPLFFIPVILSCSVDLNAADTGVQFKTTVTTPDNKRAKEAKQEKCSC